MARIRSVKPEFCTSEAIAALPRDLRLHFIQLWTYADDYGRGKDEPRVIKGAIWPIDDDVTPEQVEAWQCALAAAGRIVRYTVDGRQFFEVVNWLEHQKPNRRTESKLPAPDQGVPVVAVQEQCIDTADAVQAHRDCPAVGVVGEVEGEVEVGGDVEVAPDTSPQTTSNAARPDSPLVDVDQQVRKAVGIYSRTIAARHPEADDPGAYAYGVGQKLTDEDRASLAEWITEGDTAEDAAARLADPMRGLDPTTIRPALDPAAVQAADELAKRREQATAERLEAQRNVKPAAPPADLKAGLRGAAGGGVNQ